MSRAFGRFAASFARPGQAPPLRPRPCYEEMQPHLLGEEQLPTIATSPRKWQKSFGSTAPVADVVCLRSLRCRRSSARRAARLLFLAASAGSRPRWREGARGAVLEHRSEGEETSAARPAADARSREVRAPVFAPAVPALQRRVGVADASAEERPGAALARAAAGSRSATREHRRRVRRRVRERRAQALQRPSEASSARPRRCPSNSVRRQGVAAASVSEWRRCPGGTRGPREAKRSASCQPAPAQWPLGCGARLGACQREVRGGAPGTRRVERPSPSSPRAPEPPGGASVPRRPQAPCDAPPSGTLDRHGSLVIAEPIRIL